MIHEGPRRHTKKMLLRFSSLWPFVFLRGSSNYSRWWVSKPDQPTRSVPGRIQRIRVQPKQNQRTDQIGREQADAQLPPAARSGDKSGSCGGRLGFEGTALGCGTRGWRWGRGGPSF